MTTDRSGLHEGLVDLLKQAWPLFGNDDPDVIRERLHQTLGVPPIPPMVDVREEHKWQRDGLSGTELTWDAGFGARVQGRLLRPQGSEHEALKGALFLHCHGGVKRFGLAKLADGEDGRPEHPTIQETRDALYGGRAAAEDLARSGRIVLVHDGFGWGSRRLPLEAMPARSEAMAEHLIANRDLDEATEYDVRANPAEDAIAKALGVLGTSWAGLLAREDLIAGQVLQKYTAEGFAVLGLSGGGARAAIAAALGLKAEAVVIAAMTSSLPQMLAGHVDGHTWAFMTPGLARVADWPDIIATAAPRPLLVQYAREDRLFPLDGMLSAHEQITSAYSRAGARDAYQGAFYDVPHMFGRQQQEDALNWLKSV